MFRYPLAHTSGLTGSQWDRRVIVTTTRALPLSSQSRLQHSPNTRTYTTTTTTILVFVDDEDSRRLQHVVVHARDPRERGEGEDNPRTRRVFPHPTYPAYKAPSACALRCSGAANTCECVRSRAIAVADCFSLQLCSRINL